MKRADEQQTPASTTLGAMPGVAQVPSPLFKLNLSFRVCELHDVWARRMWTKTLNAKLRCANWIPARGRCMQNDVTS